MNSKQCLVQYAPSLVKETDDVFLILRAAAALRQQEVGFRLSCH